MKWVEIRQILYCIIALAWHTRQLNMELLKLDTMYIGWVQGLFSFISVYQLVQRLREELSASDDLTRRLRDELASVTSRLAAGIEENDQLYLRLRELDTSRGHSLPPHSRSRSVDSLSDLTNIQLDLNLSQLDKDR